MRKLVGSPYVLRTISRGYKKVYHVGAHAKDETGKGILLKIPEEYSSSIVALRILKERIEIWKEGKIDANVQGFLYKA